MNKLISDEFVKPIIDKYLEQRGTERIRNAIVQCRAKDDEDKQAAEIRVILDKLIEWAGHASWMHALDVQDFKITCHQFHWDTQLGVAMSCFGAAEEPEMAQLIYYITTIADQARKHNEGLEQELQELRQWKAEAEKEG